MSNPENVKIIISLKDQLNALSEIHRMSLLVSDELLTKVLQGAQNNPDRFRDFIMKILYDAYYDSAKTDPTGAIDAVIDEMVKNGDAIEL